ncbi:GDSL esterase/lipase [Raphanus sativus]|nr:GDSL esterase/lipase [Raphanus sativus]
MSTTTKALSLLVLLFFVVSIVHATDSCLINSIADTGNLIRNGPIGAKSHAASFPYGQTYFNQATGRCSNGQHMVDYLARRLHLPLLNPYLNVNTTQPSSFNNGVNFAVAGSTALNSSFFAARSLHVPATNTPLSTQLSWFKSHRSPSDCLKRSPIRNDYNYGFFQGKSTEEIRSFIPRVFGAIAGAAREVILTGAVNVLVPGNFPVGCFPIYLTSFPLVRIRDYVRNFIRDYVKESIRDAWLISTSSPPWITTTNSNKLYLH